MATSKLRFDHYAGSVFYRLVDYIVIVFALAISLYCYGESLSKDYVLLVSCYLVVYGYVGESLQLYRSWRAGRFHSKIVLLLAVNFLAFSVVVILLFLLKVSDTYSRVVVVAWFLSSMMALVSWRYLAKKLRIALRARGYSKQQVAIIGLTHAGIQVFREIERHSELGFECIGFFDDREPKRFGGTPVQFLKGSIDSAVTLAKEGKIAKLYIALPLIAEKRIESIIRQLGDTTVDVILIPDFLLKNLMHARIGSVGDVDTISVFESPIAGVREFYKRTFDILFSAVVLLLVSPVLLIIALLVKLTSSGPVFFKQQRYGLDGKPIGVFKFRSMKVMENGGLVTQASRNDSRITPLGRVLRKTSLDELPQFLNVLLGDMSVVGPRPHAVAHNEQYRQIVDYYMLRHKVKPGITGWAQVNGWRGETDTLEKMEKRIEFDLEYIRQWSLWFDVKIVFLTLYKGFVGKNAY